MEDQSDDSKKLNFLSEQLALHQKSSGSRRYSPQLLATCLMWENSSPATYKLFVSDDVLCLPSQKHLKRISSSGTCESDLNHSHTHRPEGGLYEGRGRFGMGMGFPHGPLRARGSAWHSSLVAGATRDSTRHASWPLRGHTEILHSYLIAFAYVLCQPLRIMFVSH